MKAYVIKENFGLHNLIMIDKKSAPLKPNEVRIKLKAASLNYRDLLMIEGKYNPKQKLPLIPLSDGAGIITEIGSKVNKLNVGDKVIGSFAQNWLRGEASKDKLIHTLGGPLDGMLQEECTLPQHGVVKFSNHFTYKQAATLPCAALTAWHALVKIGKISKNKTILLLGTGGVSIFALFIAKLYGAKVIITSSSDEKLQKAKNLGADECINYTKDPDYHQTIKQITGGKGVDLILEVGGATTLDNSLQSIKVGGTIVLIGIVGGKFYHLPLTSIIMKNIRIQGIVVGSSYDLQQMIGKFTKEKVNINPLIDKSFTFSRANEALQYFKQAQHFGKICIEI